MRTHATWFLQRSLRLWETTQSLGPEPFWESSLVSIKHTLDPLVSTRVSFCTEETFWFQHIWFQRKKVKFQVHHKNFTSVIHLRIAKRCLWESQSHQLTSVTHSCKVEFKKKFFFMSVSLWTTLLAIWCLDSKMENLVCSLKLSHFSQACNLGRYESSKGISGWWQGEAGQTGWGDDTCDRCLPSFCKAADNSEKTGSGDKLIFGTGTVLAVRPSKSEDKWGLCVFSYYMF